MSRYNQHEEATMSITTTSTTMSPMTCGECGILFNVPHAFKQKRLEDRKTWYCPNGHPRAYIESEADRLRREAEAVRKDAELAWSRFRDERAEHDAERRSHAATKGHLTRMRNRIAAGMCPWCKRNISQLREHVGEKHPEHAAQFAELAAAERKP